MKTDFTDQPGSNFQVNLKDDQVMTIIPKPVQKPFRRFEIAAGLLCIAAGIWLLAEFALWLAGAVPHLHIRSKGEALLILVQSVYLTGFSVNVLRSGYVALVFWMIAIAILVTLPLTAGLFS
jgi:hypothetical protein